KNLWGKGPKVEPAEPVARPNFVTIGPVAAFARYDFGRLSYDKNPLPPSNLVGDIRDFRAVANEKLSKIIASEPHAPVAFQPLVNCQTLGSFVGPNMYFRINFDRVDGLMNGETIKDTISDLGLNPDLIDGPQGSWITFTGDEALVASELWTQAQVKPENSYVTGQEDKAQKILKGFAGSERILEHAKEPTDEQRAAGVTPHHIPGIDRSYRMKDITLRERLLSMMRTFEFAPQNHDDRLSTDTYSRGSLGTIVRFPIQKEMIGFLPRIQSALAVAGVRNVVEQDTNDANKNAFLTVPSSQGLSILMRILPEFGQSMQATLKQAHSEITEGSGYPKTLETALGTPDGSNRDAAHKILADIQTAVQNATPGVLERAIKLSAQITGRALEHQAGGPKIRGM
ncbi:MAG: hypothetical protein AAF988_08725, partial [Pseudomonadota bacterium]